MSVDFIATLRATPPRQRLALLKQQQQRNIDFLSNEYPGLSQRVADIGFGRFRLRPDQDLVSVMDGRSRRLLHPPGQLAEFCQQLGAPDHPGWWEYARILESPGQESEHKRRIAAFLDQLREHVAHIPNPPPSPGLSLPRLADGRSFAPLTIFLGLNTGLHIAYFLAATEVQDMILVEPDIERFALSCLFLDYAALHEQFGHLTLVIGDPDIDRILNAIDNSFSITGQVWVRLLRAYDDPWFTRCYQTAGSYFKRMVYVPYERELRGMSWMRDNLLAQRPIWQNPPQLAAQSSIAVIAAGPSLNRDIPWLQAQRERLIIIAVISALKPLRAAGIVPDFQCTLDIDHAVATLERVELFRSVPLLTSSRADPQMQAWVDEALLFAEGKSVPAALESPWSHASPTSGNLALEAALRCQPQAIYLLGLDLAFRRDQPSHAEGTLHQFRQGDESQTAPLERLNHPDPNGDWVITPYYTLARYAAERALHHWASQRATVYNLSQGALIEGAIPADSAQIELPDYPERAADIQRIRQAFIPNPRYTLYDWLPEECISTPIRQLADFSDSLDWLELPKQLDQFQYRWTYESLLRDEMDQRWQAFQGFVNHILSSWYRLLWLASEEQRPAVYHYGLRLLRNQLSNLSWPEGLADFMRPISREAAAEYYRQRYAEDSEAQDYLARLAEGLATAEDWAGAVALAEEDDALGRLSPVWRLRLAEWLQCLGRTAEAEAAIERAYGEDECLRDGGVALAQRYIAHREWAQAARWFDRDASAERLSPRWWIDYAEVLARLGEFDRAEWWVHRAYAQHGRWNNGFARLGGIKAEAQDWAGALEWVKRDEDWSRLSREWQVNLAELYARCGQFDQAIERIEALYDNKKLRTQDGFARLGWVKTATEDWQGAVDLMRKDLEHQRLSATWRTQLALAEAHCGQWDSAESLITEAYEYNAVLKDGYTRLGWTGYILGQGVEYLQRLADRDRAEGRSSTAGLQAALFNAIAADDTPQAIAAAEQLYARFPGTHAPATNAFALIGLRLFVHNGAYTQGRELFARDVAQQRLQGDDWHALYAVVLATEGAVDEALAVIDSQLAVKAAEGLITLPTYHQPGSVVIIKLHQLRELIVQGGHYTDLIERYGVAVGARFKSTTGRDATLGIAN